MSFSIQKNAAEVGTSMTKAENAFVSILLYPTDARKENRESGLV